VVKADNQMHLGYHELRKLLSQLADERMAARQNQSQAPPQQGAYGAPSGPNNYGAPSGPNNYGPRSAAPPSAPSGPSSNIKMAPPQTPVHSQIPPADEMPVVGHGDKVKREAGELVEDVKVEREERRHRHEDKYER